MFSSNSNTQKNYMAYILLVFIIKQNGFNL